MLDKKYFNCFFNLQNVKHERFGICREGSSIVILIYNLKRIMILCKIYLMNAQLSSIRERYFGQIVKSV